MVLLVLVLLNMNALAFIIERWLDQAKIIMSKVHPMTKSQLTNKKGLFSRIYNNLPSINSKGPTVHSTIWGSLWKALPPSEATPGRSHVSQWTPKESGWRQGDWTITYVSGTSTEWIRTWTASELFNHFRVMQSDVWVSTLPALT